MGDFNDARQLQVREWLAQDPVMALQLAAADFEWLLRRAIVALGTSGNRHIREQVLRACRDLADYERAWLEEVHPRCGRVLGEVVVGWAALREEGWRVARAAEGLYGMPDRERLVWGVELLMAASASLTAFAGAQGVTLVGQRMGVRRGLTSREGKSSNPDKVVGPWSHRDSRA